MKGVSWRFVSGQGGAIYRILEIIGIIRTIPGPTAMHLYKIESKFSKFVRLLEPWSTFQFHLSFSPSSDPTTDSGSDNVKLKIQ